MMVISKTTGQVYHKLGDLRITGPIEEVEAFLEWLSKQNCHIYGYDDVRAVQGLKSVEMSIDIYGPGEGAQCSG